MKRRSILTVLSFGKDRVSGCGMWGSLDWIELAQDKESWRIFVNKVMNLRVS
jgi:hypothetical protein